MNRTIRSLLVVTSLLGVAVLAAPGVSAVAGGDDEDDGEAICQRVFGFKTCVAVKHNDCLLWVSAGIGGCFVKMPGEYSTA